MSDGSQQEVSFASVKDRLAEIADMVDDEGLSLDAALDLYEEAVALGLQASDLLEVGIGQSEEESEQAEAAPSEPEGQAVSHSDAAIR